MRSLAGAIFGLLMLAIGSCKNSADRPDTYFDSLIVAQVSRLSVADPLLIKVVKMGVKVDSASFHPNEPLWKSELDIFRQLSLSERASYAKAYKIEEGLKDNKSNLEIKQYLATESIPIPSLKFYYYRELKRLKRIEATYNQGNALYTTTRHLTLEFEEIKETPVLIGYSVEGVEKMILGDSVKFSVQSRIIY